jgi:hypothetical protein
MKKQAIKVHNMRDAIWYVFPVTAKPKTTIKCFQRLQGGVVDEAGENFLWENIIRNTEESFETHYRFFSGNNHYRSGIPQNKEIFDDGDRRFEIIGSFNFSF